MQLDIIFSFITDPTISPFTIMCGSMFIFLGGLLSASLVLILSLLTCKSPLVLIPSLASEAALLYFTSTLSKPQLFALIDTLNDPFQYAALILPFLGAGTLVSALAYTDKWHQACDVAFYAQFLVATALRMLIVFSAPRYEGSTSSPEGVPVWMVGECVILLLLINYDGIGARAARDPILSPQQSHFSTWTPDLKFKYEAAALTDPEIVEADLEDLMQRTWRTDAFVISTFTLGSSLLRGVYTRFSVMENIQYSGLEDSIPWLVDGPMTMEALTLLLVMLWIQWQFCASIREEIDRELRSIYLPL